MQDDKNRQKDEKQAKLDKRAEALKANLARRKAQSRDRKGTDKPDSGG